MSLYFLQELIDSIPNPVFFKNVEGIFQGCNKAYEEFLGLSKGEIIGKTVHEITPGDLADSYHEMDLRLLREGGSQVNELKVHRSNGDERSVFLNNAIFLDADGRIGGSVGSVIDITERKQLEEQLRQVQKMEAIGTLAGGIAHDFNNILGIILGYAEIASFDVSKDSQTFINLEQVRHAARRATDLVRQILAFSRRSDQHRDPLLVTPVVKECLKLLRASIPSTIEIRRKLDLSPGEGKILADPTQIHQVLMNLCVNASHAMREKGGILEVSLSKAHLGPEELRHLPELLSGPYLKLTVSDTGHGMNAAVMNRVFEPYFTTKGLGEGTGLGLAVVHGIVKEHRGTITVRSERDKGTTFDVFFPEIEREAMEAVEDYTFITGGTGNILFVDDEPAIMDIGAKMLQRLGYEVTARSSSIEALEAFRSQPNRFDMIITDQTMPHMTGVELTREVLSIRPGIPIVICTGFSEIVSPERAKDLGVREVVMKPMVMSQIAGIIRRILDETGVDKRQ